MKSAKLWNPDAVGIAVLCRFEIQDTIDDAIMQNEANLFRIE